MNFKEISTTYDNAYHWNANLFTVLKGSKMGLIDLNNKEVLPCEYQSISNDIKNDLARHYGRVYDSSGILINNDINNINADAYPDYSNANYDSWNENNPAQNRDSASASASARITSNHWIETALREGLRSAR